MTGRAAGYCAGYGMPGYMNPIPGRGGWFGRGRGMGWGRGRGWGRGWGRGAWGGPAGAYGYGYPAAPPVYAAPPTAAQEVEFLRQQAEAMRQGLSDIEGRIQTLEKESEQKKA
jgi:hypothetical protein